MKDIDTWANLFPQLEELGCEMKLGHTPLLVFMSQQNKLRAGEERERQKV